MDNVTVKITSTIVIDGHEYVVMTMDTKASLVGRSVVIVAVDRETAENEQKRGIERETVLDAQTRVMKSIAKVVEDAVDGKGNGGIFGGM